MRFQVDDTVRVAKDSKYYAMSESNPKDTNGVITDTENGFSCRGIPHPSSVEWNEGQTAYYRVSDLKLRSRDNG